MSENLDRLNRRQFLVRLGTASAVVTVAGAGISALLTNREHAPSPVPNATPNRPPTLHPNANDPLIPAAGTRPEYTPISDHYRIDIAPSVPRIDPTAWRLGIDGLVETPMQFTLDQLKSEFTPITQYITMGCISNRIGGDLISTTLWTGASFRDVLAQAKPHQRAKHALITSADGFYETMPLDEINANPNIMLCYAFDHQPLPQTNGFPLRVYRPDRFGMKQPKWITNIELLDHDRDGFWIERGWTREAHIRETSVIDTVAIDDIYTRAEGEAPFVPIGGMAWAGTRGVSKVEIQIDNGAWHEAQLRAPLNNDLDDYNTWRIWRYDWQFAPGEHTLTVRMTDKNGTPQITDVRPEAPSGATGLHRKQTRL